MVGLNLVLNLTLIWFLREGGLALATAISATVQVIILFSILQKKLNITGYKHIFKSILKTLFATFFMCIACWVTLEVIPTGDGKLLIKFLRLLIPLAVALTVFFTLSSLLKSEELRYLYTSFRKKRD